MLGAKAVYAKCDDLVSLALSISSVMNSVTWPLPSCMGIHAEPNCGNKQLFYLRESDFFKRKSPRVIGEILVPRWLIFHVRHEVINHGLRSQVRCWRQQYCFPNTLYFGA